MEPGLLLAFAILTVLCAIAAIDELAKKEYDLGEEWDFITPNIRKKY